MTAPVLAGFADDGDDEDMKVYRRVFGKMFSLLRFNMHLVDIGMCKMYIKDMTEADYAQYLRLLWALQQMSDTPNE